VRRLVNSDKLVMPEGWTKAKCMSILNQLGRAPWNVKLLERHKHVRGVTLYLARYLKGGPIGNSRIVSYSNGEVTFRYLDRKNPANPQTKEMTLPVAQFLERWSQHIPPAKMHTVRTYGLYATGNAKRLEQARLQLGVPIMPEAGLSQPEQSDLPVKEETEKKRCPICIGYLVVEPLEFEEPVRPWNIYRAKRRSRCPRAPLNIEAASIA